MGIQLACNNHYYAYVRSCGYFMPLHLVIRLLEKSELKLACGQLQLR